MIWFILAITFCILAFYLHSSANKKETPSKGNSLSTIAAPKAKTYWETFKESNPSKAKEIETLLGFELSTLSDRDAREKKETLERLSESMKCSISQIRETYLKEIEKFPASLIPQMLESTSREMSKEMEIVKAYFPYLEIEDLQERIQSLREMSELFKCPMDGLEKFYKADVMNKYDGTYENFHFLPEAFKHMAFQASEVARKVALKPRNTSYGIMCDWLLDIMQAERHKFVDSGQVKCPYCHSTNVKMQMFDNEFKCNSCGMCFDD